MLRGLLYDASSEELTQERLAAKELCFAYLPMRRGSAN